MVPDPPKKDDIIYEQPLTEEGGGSRPWQTKLINLFVHLILKTKIGPSFCMA